MKKSKHFRKDVILARIIAGVILIVLIVLLVFVISLMTKPSGQDKDSQDSQNTQNTQDINQGNPDSESEDIEDTQNQESESGDTEPDVDIEPEPDVEEKIYVKTTAILRLRAEANTSCETLERIPEGTEVEVLEELERWYKVIYNGKEGYVSKTYVVVIETE